MGACPEQTVYEAHASLAFEVGIGDIRNRAIESMDAREIADIEKLILQAWGRAGQDEEADSRARRIVFRALSPPGKAQRFSALTGNRPGASYDVGSGQWLR